MTANKCPCGYGRPITGPCAAEGKPQPYHAFNCPNHPGAQPKPQCPTCGRPR